MPTATPTMEPLSARLPSDLYLWLAQMKVEGATTNSDKLRVLLAQLKRQHDGAFDYAAAHSWARGMTARLRESVVRIEGESGTHSELIPGLLEHLHGLLALAVSQAPTSAADAARLEDALVKRCFALGEMLLRLGTTPAAPAYDPAVVRRHMGGTIELARLLNPSTTTAGA